MTAPPTAPNEVDEPIINSPFAEPALHWQIAQGAQPVKVPGRRPASFYYRVPERAGRGRKRTGQRSLLGDTDIGEREDLTLVNWIRAHVKAWREAGWPGTSPVTRELLRLWRAGSEQRAQRLFCAQIEAAETHRLSRRSRRGLQERHAAGAAGRARRRYQGRRFQRLHPLRLLVMGLCLLIEIKGQYGGDADLKAKAALRWTAAVTRHGGFGTWRYVVVQDPPALTKLLDEHVPAEQPALALSASAAVASRRRLR